MFLLNTQDTYNDTLDIGVAALLLPQRVDARHVQFSRAHHIFTCCCSPTGLKHEVWHVPGAPTVKEKWANCLRELKTEEPHCRVFASKTDSSIISRFDLIVEKKSAENGEALRESGGGTAPDSSEESEAEYQMKVRLVSCLRDRRN